MRNLNRFKHIVSRQCSNFTSEIRDMSEIALKKGSVCPPLKPGLMRFYNMRFCPFAQRTRLVLEYKKIPYDMVNVKLNNKPDWFWKKNPNGLVPILEKDGMIVYESKVCNEYLDEMYPNPRIIPSDVIQRTKDNMLIESFGKVTGMFYELPKARANGTYDRTVKIFKKIMARYDRELSERGDYFGGSTPNNVDFMIWPWFERMEVMRVTAPDTHFQKDDMPHLSAWVDRMMQLPCVKATMFDPSYHVHFFQSLWAGNPDYDYGLPVSNL